MFRKAMRSNTWSSVSLSLNEGISWYGHLSCLKIFSGVAGQSPSGNVFRFNIPFSPGPTTVSVPTTVWQSLQFVSKSCLPFAMFAGSVLTAIVGMVTSHAGAGFAGPMTLVIYPSSSFACASEILDGRNGGMMPREPLSSFGSRIQRINVCWSFNSSEPRSSAFGSTMLPP